MGFKLWFWIKTLVHGVIISYVAHMTLIMYRLAQMGEGYVYEFTYWIALVEVVLGFICLVVLVVEIVRLISSYVKMIG